MAARGQAQYKIKRKVTRAAPGRRAVGADDGFWGKVVRDIESLAERGCYESVSDLISLYMAPKLRTIAAALLSAGGRRPEVIVDAGCGPGTSTRVVASLYPDAKVVAMDPSVGCLRGVRSRVPGAAPVQGVFEGMPLRDGSADAVVAMFSFRDAADYSRALDEIARVLRDDGVFVMLDLYRPEGGLEAAATVAQFRVFGPLAGLALGCGRDGLKFGEIYDTVTRMMTPTELVREARKRFSYVAFHRTPLLVGILYARGPRRPGGTGTLSRAPTARPRT